MPRLIELATHGDARGKLIVLERTLPFDIKRVFYIYGLPNMVRGGHRHRQTQQAAIALQGSCVFDCNDGRSQERFVLDSPSTCLILEPRDWHEVHDFAPGTILLVLASEFYDPNDYIYEDYG